MDVVFIKLLNMSITASLIALAVILLRFILKKAPKWIMGVLWAFVAIRLILPFSFESIFSLVPSVEPIPPDIISSDAPAVGGSLPSFDHVVSPTPAVPPVTDAVDSADAAQNTAHIALHVATAVWIVGVLAMLLYALIGYCRIRKKVSEGVPLKDNIWMCDRISTPFIIGIFHPRICIPSSMNEGDTEYVISHEKAHLKRKDHIWKPLGFLLLSVYWFNPILWVAYVLMCRDIELACDESIIRQFGAEIKKPYTDALINCSVPRKMISACPLAFGEVGIKERVKRVLSYKKPAFWVILAALAACIITAVCLLTDPIGIKITQINEGPEFRGLFNDIKEVTVFSSENNYTTDDKAKLDEIVGLLREVKLKKRPVSQSRDADRDKTHRIAVNQNNTLCFSENYSELWIDTGVKPTFLYKVLNPSKVKRVFEIRPDKVIEIPETPSEYRCASEKDFAYLMLDPPNKEFVFVFSMLSSHIAVGTYVEDDEYLVARTKDGKETYTFKKTAEGLAFAADRSSEVPYFAYTPGAKGEVCVPDGAVFRPVDH